MCVPTEHSHMILPPQKPILRLSQQVSGSVAEAGEAQLEYTQQAALRGVARARPCGLSCRFYTDIHILLQLHTIQRQCN